MSLDDANFVRRALRLAERAYGDTSPNPCVGAILVKAGRIIGQGWHQRAGAPHAELAAISAARLRKENLAGSTLYVTLEPCCTAGRTPPCTTAIIDAGIKRVVVAATDPNPAHSGLGFKVLEQSGVQVQTGIMAPEASRLNEAFNHWIVHRRPLVTLKSAMSLDGKIATRSGESKWITGEKARDHAMWLRRGADAILAGVQTVIVDNPSLTLRTSRLVKTIPAWKKLRRIILDPQARIPLTAKVVAEDQNHLTTVVVSEDASASRARALARNVAVLKCPVADGKFDLDWLLNHLGGEDVTSLLIEGGGETHATFLDQDMVDRIAFFYAPLIIGGRNAPKSVAGKILGRLALNELTWRKMGPDLFMTARLKK